MITELLRKQLVKEIEYIHANLYDFVEHFMERDALDFMDEENYFFAFGTDFIYIQRHWFEDNGCGEPMPFVEEGHIDYEDYNAWRVDVQKR